MLRRNTLNDPDGAGHSTGSTRLDVIVPYEWFDRDELRAKTDKAKTNEEIANHVLVLWLRDEYFDSSPLKRLKRLIEKLSSALNRLEYVTSLEEAGEAISEELSISPSDTKRLLEALVTLQTLSDKLDFPPEDLVAVLTAAIEEQAPEDWKRDYLVSWNKAAPAIV